MPRQNRVTPFGELIAVEARGTLMGNRGCLHDEEQRIRRPFALRRWIICLLEFRGRHRVVMTPGRYTELFFLDEATALAAGHRPCAECQRERYRLFREKWVAANPGLNLPPSPLADEMDRVLHVERLDAERRKRTHPAPAAELPPGVMIVDSDGILFLVLEDRLVRWAPGGYSESLPRPSVGAVQVLTPPSVVRAIREGYPVLLHPSAMISAEQGRRAVLDDAKTDSVHFT
jgi:hypothetical protein